MLGYLRIVDRALVRASVKESNKDPILLLLKFYFSNKIFNIDYLVDYFELPPEKMLIIVKK